MKRKNNNNNARCTMRCDNDHSERNAINQLSEMACEKRHRSENFLQQNVLFSSTVLQFFVVFRRYFECSIILLQKFDLKRTSNKKKNYEISLQWMWIYACKIKWKAKPEPYFGSYTLESDSTDKAQWQWTNEKEIVWLQLTFCTKLDGPFFLLWGHFF